MEGSLSLVLALMLDEASSSFNSSPNYSKALASKTHVEDYVCLDGYEGINGWENMDGLENSTVTWNSTVASVENYTAMKYPVDCLHYTHEKTFIEQVVADESDMEDVPPACSRILNWHLHLAALDVPYPQGWVIQNNIKSVTTVR
ncbi:unnamed protein product [Brassica oleracea]